MTLRNGFLAAAATVLLWPMMAAATDLSPTQAGQKAARAFDWHGNAAPVQSLELRDKRIKAAVIRARVLGKGATWVCSPAGSGMKSRCDRG